MKANNKRMATKNYIFNPTNEEIKAGHAKLISKIEANYDNKDYAPLTLHNAVHSFESYFYQYTDWLKVVPEVIMSYGLITFRWANVLDISCQGPNFAFKYSSSEKDDKVPSLYIRRDKLMEAIAEKAKNHKLPIDPC